MLGFFIVRLKLIEDGLHFTYHAYAGTKAVFLGGKDNGRTDWIPEKEEIEAAKAILRQRGVFVY